MNIFTQRPVNMAAIMVLMGSKKVEGFKGTLGQRAAIMVLMGSKKVEVA